MVWYLTKNCKICTNKVQVFIPPYLLKLAVLIVLITFKLSCLLFLLVLISILNVLNLNLDQKREVGVSTKTITIHTILLFFFISTLYQLHIFNVQYLCVVETWLKLLKVSSYSLVKELHYLDSLNSFNVNYLNCELGVITQNNINSDEVFKNIFEKKLLSIKSTLLELYSYNTQSLVQPQGLVIYLTLILVQLVLFNLSFKKLYVYI